MCTVRLCVCSSAQNNRTCASVSWFVRLWPCVSHAFRPKLNLGGSAAGAVVVVFSPSSAAAAAAVAPKAVEGAKLRTNLVQCAAHGDGATDVVAGPPPPPPRLCNDCGATQPNDSQQSCNCDDRSRARRCASLCASKTLQPLRRRCRRRRSSRRLAQLCQFCCHSLFLCFSTRRAADVAAASLPFPRPNSPPVYYYYSPLCSCDSLAHLTRRCCGTQISNTHTQFDSNNRN